MTTREEMALAFARSNYEITLAAFYDRAHSPGRSPLTDEEAAKIDQHIVHGAVEMADLLIEELSKGQPENVPVPDDAGEGWRFVTTPMTQADQYWLHGQWHDYTTENCNRDFKSGEVGAFYCPIRRKINPEPPVR